LRSSREEVPTQQFQQLIEALSATTGEHKETVMNMKKYSIKDVGIQLLLKKYKSIFRIPENLNYYSERDYRMAEKKFIKYELRTGRVDRHIESQLS
jgi:hypothetical protein